LHTPESGEEMFGRGEDLIHEAHEALLSQLRRGREEDDAVLTVLAAMRGRAGEVVENAKGCSGCFTFLLGGMLSASLGAALEGDGPGRNHGLGGDDDWISWDDMLMGGHS
jgi:hypothetical protein